MNEYFRLVQPLKVVRLAGAEEGDTVTLPAGATVEVLGSSRVPGCLRLLCDGFSYNAFEEDLRDRSTPQQAKPIAKRASGAAV